MSLWKDTMFLLIIFFRVEDKNKEVIENINSIECQCILNMLWYFNGVAIMFGVMSIFLIKLPFFVGEPCTL